MEYTRTTQGETMFKVIRTVAKNIVAVVILLVVGVFACGVALEVASDPEVQASWSELVKAVN